MAPVLSYMNATGVNLGGTPGLGIFVVFYKKTAPLYYSSFSTAIVCNLVSNWPLMLKTKWRKLQQVLSARERNYWLVKDVYLYPIDLTASQDALNSALYLPVVQLW